MNFKFFGWKKNSNLENSKNSWNNQISLSLPLENHLHNQKNINKNKLVCLVVIKYFIKIKEKDFKKVKFYINKMRLRQINI